MKVDFGKNIRRKMKYRHGRSNRRFMNANETTKTIYQIDAEESERITILKFWLCVLVVFIHSNFNGEIRFADGTLVWQCPIWLDWCKFIVNEIIACCAVPWFFLLSGILLYRKPFRWSDNMRKKVRTLLIPYLIINTFWLVFYYTAQHIPGLSVYFTHAGHIIGDYTLPDFVNAYLGFRCDETFRRFPFVRPLWFVRDLLILNFLAKGIEKIINRFPKAAFAALITSLFLCPWLVNYIGTQEITALVYFSLGYYCVKYQFHLKKLDDINPIIMFSIYVVAGLLACYLRDTMALSLCQIPIALIGGGVIYIYATKFRYTKRSILYLSQYSMAIYLFHPNNILILQKLSARLLPVGTFYTVFSSFVIPLIIIACCIVFSALLKKYTPRLYGIITGGRC